MEMVLHHQRAAAGISCSGISGGCHPMAAKQEAEEKEAGEELRRGPWTVDEDLTLINYIADHGEGRWNALARAAGLKRTGKSCRLRWLNYLRPDVKRGDFTADEQLLILDLHSRWGNRWSKIAAQLPGRTDNEIKNYWRTRVQKHAKQLNCDVNSKRFKDAMRFLWMPRLAERAAASHHQQQQQLVSSAAGDDLIASAAGALTMPEMMMTMNETSNDSRSPSSVVTTSSSSSSRTSSESTAAAMPAITDWDETMQAGADHEYWSTASALQQLTGAGAGDHQNHQLFQLFHDELLQQDLSGWVQGFSLPDQVHQQLWSLDDIWRMQ